VKINNLKIR